MFSIMPLILIGYLCLQWYRHQCISGILTGIMIIEFVLLWFIARSKGKRLAYNVIAVDIAKNTKEETKPDIVLTSK